jgi:hypothetical protein
VAQLKFPETSPNPPNRGVQYTGNPCTTDSTGKCPKCTGDCDADADCSGLLRCAQRSGGEDVPGCDFGSLDKSITDDFCTSLIP